ncbi:MAG: methyltransferase domain-containing protein [Alphaproteobacteria bacterium]|nr:MAG: methyltransferase domain-containing protein [Alphaproteobacteria bacterium]
MASQSFASDYAPARDVPRAERNFFDLVGPALVEQPLAFLCGDREYRFGLTPERTVVRVHDPRVFDDMLTGGNLGLGEAYADGKIEVVHGTLEGLIVALIRADAEKYVRGNPLSMLRVAAIHLGNLLRSRERNVQAHYDLGAELFEACLDDSLAYSCGYAFSADDALADLQRQKFDRICRKLRLKPGERLLDIGCGFGGLLIHAAKHHGVRGIGITLSNVQLKRGKERLAAERLTDRIEIVFASHERLPAGPYDKIVSVGMFEHLKLGDYPTFFRNIKSALAPEGLGLVHTIGCATEHNPRDAFMQKYIFPGGRTPTLSELATNIERCDMPILDVENMVRHYAPTTRRWLENFQRNYHKLDHEKYDARFKRIWEYYLACGAAAATASPAALWQVLFANSHKLDTPFQRV